MHEARYLEDHGDRLILRPLPEDAIARGAGLAFVVAPLVTAGASAAAWIAAADDGLAFVAGWGAGAIVAAVIASLGIALMAGARSRAARGTTTIDLSERVLERANRSVEVVRAVRAVRVRAVRGPWPSLSLELAHEDGRATPLLRAPRGQGRALAAAAEHLADALGVPTEIPASVSRARPLLPREPKLAAALCYAPIDGLNVMASIFYLMISRDPFVRFGAKQSLLLWGLEVLSMPVVLGCCSMPFATVVPPALAPYALASSLAVWLGARCAVRTRAAMRAHRGVVWIPPWFAPLARRLSPPER